LNRDDFAIQPKSIDRLKKEYMTLKEEKDTFQSLKEIYQLAHKNIASLKNYVFWLAEMIRTEVIKVDQEDDKFLALA